jgi:hypothetical protein
VIGDVVSRLLRIAVSLAVLWTVGSSISAQAAEGPVVAGAVQFGGYRPDARFALARRRSHRRDPRRQILPIGQRRRPRASASGRRAVLSS